MAIASTIFDTTPANAVADIKAKILLSTDWANITGNIVKATTTRGAQMVVDLADAVATSSQLQFGVYRTHNGTTGVDKVTRYLNWRDGGGGATTDPLHVIVSAGPDHLFISAEGSRPGEANPYSSAGAYRVHLALSDITPYFSADTIPAVALIGGSTTSGAAMTGNGNTLARVSRNQADTASWVAAKLATFTTPATSSGITPPWVSAQPNASDGNYYLWPYIVIEDIAGLRGRVSRFFFGGSTGTGQTGVDINPTPFSKFTYSGVTYQLIPALQAINSSQFSPFGYIPASWVASILVAIPVA